MLQNHQYGLTWKVLPSQGHGYLLSNHIAAERVGRSWQNVFTRLFLATSSFFFFLIDGRFYILSFFFGKHRLSFSTPSQRLLLGVVNGHERIIASSEHSEFRKAPKFLFQEFQL